MGAKSDKQPSTMKIDQFIRSRTRRRLFMLPTPSKIVSVLYYPFLWEPLTAFGLWMRDDPAARGIKTRFCYNQLSFFSHPAFCACGCKQAQSGSGGTGRHTILRGWRRKAWGFKSPLPHQVLKGLAITDAVLLDNYCSRDCMRGTDCGGAAAARQERRHSGNLWRHGQPDCLWPARHSHRLFPADYLVRHHFHDHIHGPDLHQHLAWVVVSDGQGSHPGGNAEEIARQNQRYQIL